jgi:hypothetical protein
VQNTVDLFRIVLAQSLVQFVHEAGRIVEEGFDQFLEDVLAERIHQLRVAGFVQPFDAEARHGLKLHLAKIQLWQLKLLGRRGRGRHRDWFAWRRG